MDWPRIDDVEPNCEVLQTILLCHLVSFSEVVCLLLLVLLLPLTDTMVIANSDSTSTLVSLDHALKRVSSLEALHYNKTEDISFRLTSLFLPEDDALCVEVDDDYSATSEVPVYLASNDSSIGVDECLRCLPQILDARDELLAQPVRRYQRSSKERILYVGQGEMAHAVPRQCDVMLSDKATTCHILAVRSTSDYEAEPLTSMTHLDTAHVHDDCIRSMIQEHHKHHYSTSSSSTPIQLDIHVLGGFLDANGSSRDISNWLLHLLADVATEYQDTMHMSLQTCVMTCLNDTGHASPVGRGLAIDLGTGQVHLAAAAADCTGPCPTLRAARLWSPQPRTLSVIHTAADASTNFFTVEPFWYTSSFQDLDALLSLPDRMLLRYCSTSPDCEQDDFCTLLRSTLKWIRNVPCEEVFGCNNNNQQPKIYRRRQGHSNAWELVVVDSSS